MKKREYLTIIIEPDLQQRLRATAKKEYRTLGRQAALFIEQGLAALERQAAAESSTTSEFYQEANV